MTKRSSFSSRTLNDVTAERDYERRSSYSRKSNQNWGGELDYDTFKRSLDAAKQGEDGNNNHDGGGVGDVAEYRSNYYARREAEHDEREKANLERKDEAEAKKRLETRGGGVFAQKIINAKKVKEKNARRLKIERRLLGVADIHTYLKDNKLVSRFKLNTVQPLRQAAAGSAVVPVKETKRVTFAEPISIVRVVKSLLGNDPPPLLPFASFTKLDAGDVVLNAVGIASLSRQERVCAAFLLSAHRRVRFDCGNQPECRNSEHGHDCDDTELGRLWFPREMDAKSKHEYACRVPIDPFNVSQFPLAKFVPGYREDSGKARRTDPVHLMSTSDSFSVSMLRLRSLYHTEMANAQATRERRIAEAHIRYGSDEAIFEHLGECLGLTSETMKARDSELYTIRAVYTRSCALIDAHFVQHVIVTMYKSRQKFHLPRIITLNALLDVLKLPSGREWDDKFFLSLFCDIANGNLENVEREKQRVSRLHGTAAAAPAAVDASDASEEQPPTVDVSQTNDDDFIERISQQAIREQNRKRERESVLGQHRETAAALTAELARADAADAAAVVTITTGGGESQPLAKRPRQQQRAYPTPPSSPPALLDPSKQPMVKEMGGGYYRIDAFNCSLMTPCASQFVIEDAAGACTSIAFHVAVEFLGLTSGSGSGGLLRRLVETPWIQVLADAAAVWRDWRLTAGGVTFMHAPEVLTHSSVIRDILESSHVVSTELGGPLHGNSMIGSTRNGDNADWSTPTLETALSNAARLSKHFGAVFSARSSSLAIGYVKGRLLLFDSHGSDVSGMSTLAQFDSVENLAAYVRWHFPLIHRSDNVEQDDVVVAIAMYNKLLADTSPDVLRQRAELAELRAHFQSLPLSEESRRLVSCATDHADYLQTCLTEKDCLDVSVLVRKRVLAIKANITMRLETANAYSLYLMVPPPPPPPSPPPPPPQQPSTAEQQAESTPS